MLAWFAQLKSIIHSSDGLKIVLRCRIQLRAHVVTLEPQPDSLDQPFLDSAAEFNGESIVAKRRLRKHVHSAQEYLYKRLQFAIAPTELYLRAITNIFCTCPDEPLRTQLS